MMYGLFRTVWDDGEDCYVSHFILMMDANTEQMTEDSKKRLADYINGNGEILKTEFVGFVTKNEMTADTTVDDSHFKEGWECIKDRFYNMYFLS